MTERTGITFTPAKHLYRLDGLPVPSVTTILGNGLPKKQLQYWSAKCVAEYVADHDAQVETLRGMGRNSMVAALKEVPWTQRDTAAVRGTEVHALAEQLVHGQPVDVPELLVGHVEGYAKWLDTWQPTPILTEMPVASREHWYAGRFDLVADIGADRWMLDVKTARGVYGDNALQAAAYRAAEFYQDGDTEHPMPEGITRLGVIHVTDAGSTLIPLDSTDEPFRDFLHVAWIARRTDKIKKYVHLALDTPTTGATT